MRGSIWAGDDANAPSTSSSQSRPPPPPPAPTSLNSRRSRSNVFRLLVGREVSPRTKHSSKILWGEASKQHVDSFGLRFEAERDPMRGLISWVEAESLRYLSAKYCPLLPSPRSTIAAAFSSDGKSLASTHGDHTVKIIDCQTGSCLKVLRGHRRTPWVVRFHPLNPKVLASGSLDHEVRLWDANTAECIGSRDFYRPIASIAFHAHGDLLAVASGHKLYIWHYNRRGETSSPRIVLRTRRSLRAVHFHPHGAPFLLTAEVNDLDLSDSSMTLATRPDGGASHVQQRVDSSASVCLLTFSTSSGQYELLLSPIEPNNSSPVPVEERADSLMREIDSTIPESATENVETMEMQPGERSNHLFPSGDPTYWELPFLQGWLAGQSQAGQHTTGLLNGSAPDNFAASGEPENSLSSVMPNILGQSRVSGRSGSGHRSSRSHVMSTTGSGEGSAFVNLPHNESGTEPAVRRFQLELANSLAAAELPCTVKLRIWPHDMKDPSAPLEGEQCRLTIPHAVLCSEMGAHFSPCGRFLAACVACVLPQLEADPGLQNQVDHDVPVSGTSPTRHPISAHQVMYELRIYSLEEATFGLILASRAIRAAHCLTSIQFSPTSEHLLLAYGRRHSSLLKSVIIDGETTVPIYTILEVYRVSDMELVQVLPSAEDEVNVACFHPSIGGGLVYGTKEGKLRILQYDSSHNIDKKTPCFLDENMLEVPSYALEC
ncbi:hypothetical protein QYF36_017793 [Acer negundo]|nr:hypothetical protein QYF36_017793 [Acer negundo]